MLYPDYTPSVRPRNKGVPIYVGGRVVGRVRGDTFYKSIAPNHYLKKPFPAIAFDVQSLRDAEQAGAVWVEVKDRKTKQVYRARIEHLWRAGTKFDRGWGAQIFLGLENYIQSGPAIQLGMFVGVGA